MTGRWSGWRSCCLVAVPCVLLWSFVNGDGRAATPDPATHAGQSRVLLILAMPDDAQAAEQVRMLAADRAGAEERDLVLVEPAAPD